MSVWTHVAAVFRIDGFKGASNWPTINGRITPKWDKIIGRTIYEGDWTTQDSYVQRQMEEDWEAYRKHPSRFVPTGSEGSLQRLVWENPDHFCMAGYVVTVFGDLRDYDDVDAIRKWFDSVCDKCYIRQATCHCNVNGKTVMWEWGDE